MTPFIDNFPLLDDLSKVQLVARLMIDTGTTPAEALRQSEDRIKKQFAGKSTPPTRGGTCAECGGPVVKYRVNISKCTNVGGGYTHVTACQRCKKETYIRR